jgi:glycosyl transferase family 25
MQYIDKVVYINLDKREDRLVHIMSLLETYNISAIRYPAIEHDYGLYGCGISHLNVLKMARDNKWNNVLILEDDILFNFHSSEIERMVSKLFEEGPEFDVCMLDVNIQRAEPAEQDWLLKVRYAHCAGAYIVKSHYYQKLIDLYEWALPNLLSSGMHWIYANDAVWQQLQETDNWITFKDQICRQMSGYSDTKNMVI